MRIHGCYVCLCSTGIEPLGLWNKPLRGKRPDTTRPVERSQNEPPAGQAVSARIGWCSDAVVWTTTDAVVEPFGDCRLIGWRPATVLVEPLVGATDSLSEGQHT